MINGYAYITLLVNDQDEAVSFYQEKLGLEVRMDVPFTPEDRWVTVAPVGAFYPEISLTKASSSAQQGAVGQQTADVVLLVLTTEDVAQSRAELVSKGVNVVSEIETVPWGRFFSLKDPYGNLIDVLQPAPR